MSNKNEINHENLMALTMDSVTTDETGGTAYVKIFTAIHNPSPRTGLFFVQRRNDRWLCGCAAKEDMVGVVLREVQEIDEITSLFTAITGYYIETYQL